MRERVLVSEIITLTSPDGAARSACTDALVGRGLLPTFASAELWGAVEPPVPVAGARGSDCFYMDLTPMFVREVWATSDVDNGSDCFSCDFRTPEFGAGVIGSDCFSVGFTPALISGTPAGGTFDWTVLRRRISKRLLKAGLVLGVPVIVA